MPTAAQGCGAWAGLAKIPGPESKTQPWVRVPVALVSTKPGQLHTIRALDSGAPSMGAVGSNFDIAMIESFWSRMRVDVSTSGPGGTG